MAHECHITLRAKMTRKLATIHRLGQILAVEPDCPELVSCLSSTRIAVRADELHGIKAIRETAPLTVSNDAGSYTGYPAGLEGRICRCLHDSGYQINFTNHNRPARPLTPAMTGHAGLDAAAKLIQHHDQGLIRIKSESLIPKLLSSIATALPTSKLAVVGGSDDAIKKGSTRFYERRP